MEGGGEEGCGYKRGRLYFKDDCVGKEEGGGFSMSRG